MIEQVKELLSKTPMTAAEVAKTLSITRPTAYGLIAKSGAKPTGAKRQGGRGPAAKVYAMPAETYGDAPEATASDAPEAEGE